MRVFKRANTAGQTLSHLGHSLFLFCLAPGSRVGFLILSQSVGLKKKKLKKITRGLGIAGPRKPG